MCSVGPTAVPNRTKCENAHTMSLCLACQPTALDFRVCSSVWEMENVCAMCVRIWTESKMKLACVFSKSIHECGGSEGNCSVCADLVEKRKTLSRIPYGTEAVERKVQFSAFMQTWGGSSTDGKHVLEFENCVNQARKKRKMVEIVKYPLKFGNREQCGCEGLVKAKADSEWISPAVFKGGSTAWCTILAPLVYFCKWLHLSWF